ncbi:hypothetical protein [Halorussus marinus]|uniref:hypothetical protein n=1 Tax=Halorussus marinus TaxID=2505976 RepID=UPI001FD6A826|nr:hypothetical protein [Halorussus marinus]
MSDRDADEDRPEAAERAPDEAEIADRSAEPLGDLAADVRSRSGDSPSRTGPLADVASEVDERRRSRETDAEGPFESVDVGQIDGEALWERLADDDGDFEVSAPTAVADAEWLDGRDVRTVEKSTCHGCPYFADPPTVACTNEGTDILEMPDVDHFRVADCPMVVDDDEVGSIATDAE